MSDGATTVNNKRQVSNSPVEERGFSSSSTPSGLKNVSSGAPPSSRPTELRSYFDILRGLTQASELSHSQRLEVFRVIIQKIVLSPVNPYSKIEKDLRNEMIESVAEVLADSPHPLPRLISRTG